MSSHAPRLPLLSYYPHQTLTQRTWVRQERKGGLSRYGGRLVRVKDYEDSALVARWIEQLASALEYVEKLGFCHNDISTSNCLLDGNFNLVLTDFCRATTIGKFLEGVLPPQSMPITAGLLKGSHGLCSAITEQFALGTLLYMMVYGHEPYDGIHLQQENPKELERRFGNMEFPELNRHEVFDELISACWHNVYPTMAFVDGLCSVRLQAQNKRHRRQCGICPN